MTPEEAYQEALRRIREAEETGALELDLRGLKMLDRLPPELANLTSLQSLDLHLCMQLSGDLSPLAGFPSLQSLNLRGCKQLTGDLSPLAGFTSLQSLNLRGCRQLSGDLSPLASLTSLQSLNLLACSSLSGDLSPLASLTSLQALDLYGCAQLSGDLSPLAGLISLQRLYIYGCKQLSGDLSQLAGLTSLQSLNLGFFGHLNGDLSPLAGLTSLQSLNLSGCGQLSGGLSPLAGLTSLQSFDLFSCQQLSGGLSPLADLTSLQSLNLRFCGQLSGDLSPLAGLTSLQSLNLSGCKLSGDLSPLTDLTSLQSLNLLACSSLSGDLSPLTDLTSLQSLGLAECTQISDLSPLVSLISLQSLDLSRCLGIRRFAPLESLLPTLKRLILFGCKLDDLPPGVCGEFVEDNVLDKVRAHYKDLKAGERIDAEVKVLFLGNGGVGKTQLCRRLRDLPFDPSVPTTHGIQLGEMTFGLDGFQEPVQLNLWDFGGQDIYHGSHALFLHGRAVFLLLWMPELECHIYQEDSLSFRHRPLSYWIDYLRAFAGTDASVLIVQSQCDTRDKRVLHPPAPVDDFPFHRFTEVSARTGLNLGVLKEHIKEAVRDRFDRRPPPPIGAGRLKVRDQLRQMLEEDEKCEPTQLQHRLLERAEFDRLCDEVGGVSDKDALLDFLRHNGVIFYRPGLFGDRIVLDQNWALEAIYALFDRQRTLPLLRGYGRFSRADLQALIWSGYTYEEQKVFLGMMEGCGICFEVRMLPNGESEYIAPELLPKWSDAQELLLGRLRDDPPDAEATARYAFLHEGVLRGYLSKLGEHAKDAAIYWKYGCWFYEQKTRSQVLIESQWDDAASEAGAGDIHFRAWGENAENLIDLVLEPLRKLPVGQAPEIEQTKRIRGEILITGSAVPRYVQDPHGGDAFSSSRGDADMGDKSDGLQITDRPEISKSKPEIFVSFAWGDDSSDDARKRTEIVDRLCETLGHHGWHILRDSNVLRPGDLISGFMKRIGLADHVIVVLSDKYLRSPYCVTELYSIYQRSVGEKEDFLRRIIPLRLDDTRFSNWRDRVAFAEYWEAEFKAMEAKFRHLAEADFRLYKAMQEWHNRIGDMLAYVNDTLHPHGFDEIVKDDFAALRQMLERR
jgi:internalin A